MSQLLPLSTHRTNESQTLKLDTPPPLTETGLNQEIQSILQEGLFHSHSEQYVADRLFDLLGKNSPLAQQMGLPTEYSEIKKLAQDTYGYLAQTILDHGADQTKDLVLSHNSSQQKLSDPSLSSNETGMNEQHFTWMLKNPALTPKNTKTNPKKLTESDYQAAAKELGVDVATVKAVSEVESRGAGFLSNGKPKILFEAHQFSKRTQRQYDKTHPQISSKKRNVSLYQGGHREYSRLAQAMELNESAALKACSWGKFQIMGFNHKLAGFKSVEAFAYNMMKSEGEQLKAFVKFIKSETGMHQALKKQNWAKFAKLYNGSDYRSNYYDTKLANAYQRYSRMKN